MNLIKARPDARQNLCWKITALPVISYILNPLYLEKQGSRKKWRFLEQWQKILSLVEVLNDIKGLFWWDQDPPAKKQEKRMN